MNQLWSEATLTEPDAEGGTHTASAAHPDEDGDLLYSTDKPSSPLPAPLLPLPPDEHLRTLAELSTETIHPRISQELGARPKRERRPPDRLGYPPPQMALTQSHGSRSSQSKGTHFPHSAPSQLTSQRVSRHSYRSSSSHTSRLSDTQHCMLDEKAKRDELEELRKQRQEDDELDEKCALIDKKAKDAQRVQEEAHREREKLIRQRDLDRRIRIKEQELESAKLITSFTAQNSESSGDGETAHMPSPPHGDVANLL